MRKNGKLNETAAIDLFCGAGGLTRGLLDAGVNVVAGCDIDEACRFPYEDNNRPAVFLKRNVADLKGHDLLALYPRAAVKILVGCAPCQPFSRYSQGQKYLQRDKWGLLYHFSRLVEEVGPDVVSMENVCELQHHLVYEDFIGTLEALEYRVSSYEVYCPQYGIPQQRTRLVVLASKRSYIKLIPPTHRPEEYITVRAAISHLPRLEAGGICTKDPLHRACTLSKVNSERIKHSIPGGTWRDWPEELVAKCHRSNKGKTYPSVYGRMQWELPSPTITTQFYGFGNGRFGHPKQDRALSLREGAILQSFPSDYRFTAPNAEHSTKAIGRMIGNAVPVRLGEAVGKSIKQHLTET